MNSVKEVAFILFQDFETLDVFGLAEILGRLKDNFHVEFYSVSGGIVSNMHNVSVFTNKAYWTEVLKLMPDLRFEFISVLTGGGLTLLLFIIKEIEDGLPPKFLFQSERKDIQGDCQLLLISYRAVIVFNEKLFN